MRESPLKFKTRSAHPIRSIGRSSNLRWVSGPFHLLGIGRRSVASHMSFALMLIIVSQTIQSTCAEDRRKDPALSVAHRAAVGRDPAVQDVGAAAPLRGVDPTSVAALPLALQNTQIIITVHLETNGGGGELSFSLTGKQTALQHVPVMSLIISYVKKCPRTY